MSRTYQIVQTPSGMWRILSNGKPLRWSYTSRDYAEYEVRELKVKAEIRAESAARKRRLGIKPAPRDSLRKKAYAAERAVSVLADGPSLRTRPAYELGNLCVSWAHAAGLTQITHPPTVRFSDRKRGAHAFMNSITLGSRSDLGTLVHEYAHCLTWDEQPAHGPRWAAMYVRLVRVAFDPTWPGTAAQLEQQFINIGLLKEAAA